MQFISQWKRKGATYAISAKFSSTSVMHVVNSQRKCHLNVKDHLMMMMIRSCSYGNGRATGLLIIQTLFRGPSYNCSLYSDDFFLHDGTILKTGIATGLFSGVNHDALGLLHSNSEVKEYSCLIFFKCFDANWTYCVSGKKNPRMHINSQIGPF